MMTGQDFITYEMLKFSMSTGRDIHYDRLAFFQSRLLSLIAWFRRCFQYTKFFDTT